MAAVWGIPSFQSLYPVDARPATLHGPKRHAGPLAVPAQGGGMTATCRWQGVGGDGAQTGWGESQTPKRKPFLPDSDLWPWFGDLGCMEWPWTPLGGPARSWWLGEGGEVGVKQTKELVGSFWTLLTGNGWGWWPEIRWGSLGGSETGWQMGFSPQAVLPGSKLPSAALRVLGASLRPF